MAATDLLAGVSLRPTTPDDREFLVGLYADTRKAELDQVVWPEGARDAFVRMQFDAQDVQYRGANPQGTFDVVEVDGVPAGRLYVDRRASDIRIVDVALLAQFQGRGIGGALVRTVLEEAAASGRTASIHVEVHNRARALYERLGFTPVEERGLYLLLEWRAP